MNIDLNERELIDRLKAGDEPAFRLMVDKYRNRVYYSVLNILQDTDDAEDAAQDTFIQVFESIRNFKEASSLSTWIYSIAVRKALEKIRKEKLKKRLYAILPWWMPEENKSKDSVYLNPGIAAENKERATILYKAIESLSENQRIAFNLIRVQGMKYDEVGEIMQLSVKAVESLVERAKQNLKAKLEKYYRNN